MPSANSRPRPALIPQICLFCRAERSAMITAPTRRPSTSSGISEPQIGAAGRPRNAPLPLSQRPDVVREGGAGASPGHDLSPVVGEKMVRPGVATALRSRTANRPAGFTASPAAPSRRCTVESVASSSPVTNIPRQCRSSWVSSRFRSWPAPEGHTVIISATTTANHGYHPRPAGRASANRPAHTSIRAKALGSTPARDRRLRQPQARAARISTGAVRLKPLPLIGVYRRGQFKRSRRSFRLQRTVLSRRSPSEGGPPPSPDHHRNVVMQS